MSKQFNVVPSKPATITVHPTAGVGDATTIQDGIDMLPAEGGIILIREGTYAITVAIATSDKNIILQGSSPGSTIIDIGANVIAAISFGFDRNYRVADLTIRGSGAVGQRAFEAAAAVVCTQLISISNVEIGNPDYTSVLEKAFVAVAGGFPCVSINECLFRLTDTATALFIDGTGDFDIEYTDCHDGVSAGGYFGGMAGDPNVHMRTCIIGIGNEMAVYSAYLEDCTFNGDGTITAAELLEAFACYFSGETAGGPARFIDLTFGFSVVMGCTFTDATSETIRISADFNRIIGNENCTVTETVTADNNIYDDNLGFAGSTIISDTSSVDGSFAVDDTTGTTPGFTTIFTRTGIKGMLGVGTVKNTGANSLEVRETVTDMYGVTDSVTTTVLAGADYMLDLQTNFSTARPPYVSYAVAIRHPGAATTYSLRFAVQGSQS